MEVRLVPLSLERVNDYVRWFNTAVVRKRLMPETPRTKNMISNWINVTVSDSASQYFSIFLPEENVYVGHVGLKCINTAQKTAEIGIVIGEPLFWRKHIGTLAFKELLKVSPDEIDSLNAIIDKKNRPSILFFLSLGFTNSKNQCGKSNKLVFHIPPQ